MEKFPTLGKMSLKAGFFFSELFEPLYWADAGTSGRGSCHTEEDSELQQKRGGEAAEGQAGRVQGQNRRR